MVVEGVGALTVDAGVLQSRASAGSRFVGCLERDPAVDVELPLDPDFIAFLAALLKPEAQIYRGYLHRSHGGVAETPNASGPLAALLVHFAEQGLVASRYDESIHLRLDQNVLGLPLRMNPTISCDLHKIERLPLLLAVESDSEFRLPMTRFPEVTGFTNWWNSKFMMPVARVRLGRSGTHCAPIAAQAVPLGALRRSVFPAVDQVIERILEYWMAVDRELWDFSHV